jgi:hypothetical protein
MQREDIRSDLGLDERSQMDPNVMAEQLVIADEPLFAFLFNPHTTREVFSETAQAMPMPSMEMQLNWWEHRQTRRGPSTFLKQAPFAQEKN